MKNVLTLVFIVAWGIWALIPAVLMTRSYWLNTHAQHSPSDASEGVNK